jgi:hypothetical protein
MAARQRQIRATREDAVRTDERATGRPQRTCPAMMKIKRRILDEVTSKFPRGQKSEFS